MLTETVFAILSVSLLYVCMKMWGLEGVGVSFFALYVSYTITMRVVCNRITGFRWSRKSLFLILTACCAVVATLVMVRTLSVEKGTLGGLLVTGAVSIGCLVELQRLLKFDIKQLIPLGISRGKIKHDSTATPQKTS